MLGSWMKYSAFIDKCDFFKKNFQILDDVKYEVNLKENLYMPTELSLLQLISDSQKKIPNVCVLHWHIQGMQRKSVNLGVSVRFHLDEQCSA